MAEDNQIQMPGSFGGLMRYKEEYDSVLKLSPAHVIGFIVLIVAFVVALKILRPIA